MNLGKQLRSEQIIVIFPCIDGIVVIKQGKDSPILWKSLFQIDMK